MNSYAIETHHVSRAFGKTEAVKDLNLKVRRGSIYGFLGRNGAGKTTTIKNSLLLPSWAVPESPATLSETHGLAILFQGFTRWAGAWPQ